MAAAQEVAPQRRINSLLFRPGTPFIEDLRHRGWPHIVEVRHEYPFYVGKNREGLEIEVWRQYLRDPQSQLGELGERFSGWTGPEVQTYRGFTYSLRDRVPEVIDDIFLRDRRAAADMDVPKEVLDQMFERPERGVPVVEYVDTAAGRVIKQIRFT